MAAVEGYCRTCMNSATIDALHYIFYETNIMEKTLPEVLDYVADLKVDVNDDLPNYICTVCLNLAKSALIFKEQCQRSEIAFKEMNKLYYQDRESVKSEMEQCTAAVAANELPGFQMYQDGHVKEEGGGGAVLDNFVALNQADDDDAASNCVKVATSEKSASLYQCAVCNLCFAHCRQLQEHVESAHEEMLDALVNKDNLMFEEGGGAKCERCHKKFSERRKLLSHLQRCEKRYRKSLGKHSNEQKSISSSACASLDGDDFDNYDSGTDNSVEERIHTDDIKTEPEVLINTTDSADDNRSSSDNKDYVKKKSHRSKRRNGITKKERPGRKKPLPSPVDEEPEETACLTPPVVYGCTKCERKFRSESSLSVHLKKHEEQLNKVYTCDKCKREFHRKGHLDNHILSHSTDEGYTCNLCPKVFARKESLALHLANHKGIKKHQCTFCKKGFNVLSTLKDHIRTHTGEKPFLCSICGKGFSQSTNLKEHLRRHQGHKPYKCDFCERNFVSKGELEAHTRKHSGAHPFVCDACGGGFTTSSSLVKHRRIHTGERPYTCDYCPMRFTALGTLKNHRRRHTGEKPYKCCHCDKAFAQKNDLVSHTRTHTGERPYVCAVCGHAFRQSSALKTHLKTHNPTVAGGGGGGEHSLHRSVDLKPIVKLPSYPLRIDSNVQMMTGLMEVKECHEDSASLHMLTPKSETSQ